MEVSENVVEDQNCGKVTIGFAVDTLACHQNLTTLVDGEAARMVLPETTHRDGLFREQMTVN